MIAFARCKLLLLAALLVLPSCVRTTHAPGVTKDGGASTEASVLGDGSAGDAGSVEDGLADTSPPPDVFDPCTPDTDGGLAAPFAGGSGVGGDPFLICEEAQLSAIGADPSLMQAHFRLLRDVDLANISFAEIGASDEPFRGVFDGRGHTISNLQLSSTPQSLHGLFRATEGARIHDLNLANVVIGSSAGIVHRSGALVGLATDTTIERIRAAVEIWSGDAVGGLIGEMQGGSLRDVHVVGIVDLGPGSDGVGGLAGHIFDAVVERAGVRVELRSRSSDPFGVSAIGGLAAIVGNSNLSDVYVRAPLTFSNATSTDPNGVAGLVAWMDGGSMKRAYVTGPVITGSPSAAACFASLTSTTESVFFDSETIVVAPGTGCDLLTTAQLQTPSTMVASGFDPTVWRLVQGSYPELYVGTSPQQR